MQTKTTHAEIKIPWMLGLIATRSVDKEVAGIHELVEGARQRIASGVLAYAALQQLRANHDDAKARADLELHENDPGYALLLKRIVADPRQATPQQIEQAAWSTVPNVPVLFWSFRVMVALGMYFIVLFGIVFVLVSRRSIERHPGLLRLALYSLPLPWIAIELGWIVAEYGRQPWVIEGILPTFMGVSSVSATQVMLSLAGFVIFYTGLAVVDLFLMFRIARGGPDGWFRSSATDAAHA
jgi:cytochrome d ubiquinol oxidase subunit I